MSATISAFPRPARRHALSLAVALAAGLAAAQPAFAEDLDGGTVIVGEDDAPQDWNLSNGAALRVIDGRSHRIKADASHVVLDGATVESDPTGQPGAVHLANGSTLDMRDSTLQAGLTVGDGSSATLVNSRVRDGSGFVIPRALNVMGGSRVDADGSHFITSGGGSNGETAVVVLDGSELTLRNGSSVTSDGYGVALSTGAAVTLDASTVQAGSGPAFMVATSGTGGAADPARISIRNGATVSSATGVLLHVYNYSNPLAEGVDFEVDDSRLQGDIVVDPGITGRVTASLTNNARIAGRFINVGRAAIGDTATWQLTGDSNVGQLQLDAGGTVQLGDGSSFNTLTVDQFIGNGGTLAFNTVLGDDASQTDRLVITGDSSGQANVRVYNAGGQGAQTGKGIELISVGGASNGQFDLVGRAVGGQYEYFLFKDDADGNWYLRSQLATTPDPCVTDPTLPECERIAPIDPIDPINPVNPTPVLRPETGAYLANQDMARQFFQRSRGDRTAGQAMGDGVQGWARVDSLQARFGAVHDQLALRSERNVVQVGADVGLFDEGRGRLGVMLGSGRASSTSTSELTGFSARGRVDGQAAGVYGAWAGDNAYVESWVQRGQFRNRVDGDGLAPERYDSRLWQASLEAGYRWQLAQIGGGVLSLQPELQLVQTDARTDTHTERNGTVVRGLGESGLSGRAGLRLQGEALKARGAAISPYVAANWYRDGRTDGMAFDGEAMRSDAPRNRYALSGGARIRFEGGWSAWGDLELSHGDSGYRQTSAQLGLGYRW